MFNMDMFTHYEFSGIGSVYNEVEGNSFDFFNV